MKHSVSSFAIFLVISALRTDGQISTTTISPEVIDDIFGTPPTTQPLEDITVATTLANTRFTDSEGRACRCVPYFLCDAITNTTADDGTITGTGVIDIRFREDSCTQSTEVCCHDPKSEEQVPTSIPPDPSRLKGCGFRNRKGIDFSIIGGTGKEAQFGEFPWAVALMLRSGNYTCGGSLIHPSVVVTGTHCVLKYNAQDLKIRAGEWDTQTDKERFRYQERDVMEIVSYADYNRKTLYNDMSLLRLSEPVNLADHINVICLPDQDQSFDSSKDCVATGWGKDKFGLKGRYAVILKKVDLDMVAHDRCQRHLRNTRLGASFKLHNTFVCAGGVEGKDTCQGDGGSPLVCPVAEDRYSLTGMVAWGIGCGMKDVPAVYVRVAHFRQWIDETLTNWGYDISGYQPN